MSMTVDIYDALTLKVQQFAADQSPAIPVCYPNIPFTPPGAGLWLEELVFWSEGADYGMADDGPTVEQSFFRVAVHGQPGSGIMTAHRVAEAILGVFPKGTLLGPARVYRAPSITGVVQSDTELSVYTTIRWRATR